MSGATFRITGEGNVAACSLYNICSFQSEFLREFILFDSNASFCLLEDTLLTHTVRILGMLLHLYSLNKGKSPYQKIMHLTTCSYL